MNDTDRSARLAPLRRASGAFAMLAVDQREALRNMMAEHSAQPVTDQDLQDFKLNAARILTPAASAVLIDRQFALDAAIEQGVVDASCGLIGSADHFSSAHGELVGHVEIDREVDPAALAARGAVALKLLVLYRPDEDSAGRIAMTREFIAMCHDAGLASIVEPVSRAPIHAQDWDRDAGILRVAEELGHLGADLYKAEIPFHGEGDEQALRRACRALTNAIEGEWVVLSSGVAEDVFPTAMRIACEEGASGFLAGRAVWASSLGAEDIDRDLRTNALARLENYAAVADTAITR